MKNINFGLCDANNQAIIDFKDARGKEGTQI